MKNLLLATAFTAVAFVCPALAGGPGVPTGIWCEIDVATEAEGWLYFERKQHGKFCGGGLRYKLVLKPSGNFVLDGGDYEVRCTVDPKSYFKGWADYTCISSAPLGGFTKSQKKFTFDGRELGLSSLDARP